MKPTRTLLAAMILATVAACAPALASTDGGDGGCSAGPYAELTRGHDKQCVVPQNPTATNETCNGPGGITIPGNDDDGVLYRIDGGLVPSGFIAVPPGDYTVTAQPGKKFRFPKQFDATWTLTVEPGGCDTTTTSTSVPETTTTAVPGSTTTTTVAESSPAPVAPPAAPVASTPTFTG